MALTISSVDVFDNMFSILIYGVFGNTWYCAEDWIGKTVLFSMAVPLSWTIVWSLACCCGCRKSNVCICIIDENHLWPQNNIETRAFGQGTRQLWRALLFTRSPNVSIARTAFEETFRNLHDSSISELDGLRKETGHTCIVDDLSKFVLLGRALGQETTKVEPRRPVFLRKVENRNNIKAYEKDCWVPDAGEFCREDLSCRTYRTMKSFQTAVRVRYNKTSFRIPIGYKCIGSTVKWKEGREPSCKGWLILQKWVKTFPWNGYIWQVRDSDWYLTGSISFLRSPHSLEIIWYGLFW